MYYNLGDSVEILIIVLIVLATLKVTFQGIFARKHISNIVESISFNGVIYFFASLIFSYALKCSLPVIAFASLFGLLTVLFQLFYITAMRCGNISLTVLIVNSSMIIPIIVSVLFFNERLGILKIIGIAAIFIALFLSTEKSIMKFNSKWILFSLLAFLTNGSLAVCQQMFGKTIWRKEGISFVAWSYLLATGISFVIYLVFKSKQKESGLKINNRALLYGLFIGVILGVFQLLNTKAIATIDAGLFFPVYNGGTLLLTTIMGVFLFKERLRRKQIASIVVGIIGIVLINI
jgi:drug/metabolite transporter (DMT)-like permease